MGVNAPARTVSCVRLVKIGSIISTTYQNFGGF